MTRAIYNLIIFARRDLVATIGGGTEKGVSQRGLSSPEVLARLGGRAVRRR